MVHSQPARTQSRRPLPTPAPAGYPNSTGRPALSWHAAAEPVVPSCKQSQPEPAARAIYHNLVSGQHGRPQKQAHDRPEQASPAGRRKAVAGAALSAQAAFPRQDAQQHGVESACLGEAADHRAVQACNVRQHRLMRAVLAHLREIAAVHKTELKEEKELMECGEQPVGPQVPWTWPARLLNLRMTTYGVMQLPAHLPHQSPSWPPCTHLPLLGLTAAPGAAQVWRHPLLRMDPAHTFSCCRAASHEHLQYACIGCRSPCHEFPRCFLPYGTAEAAAEFASSLLQKNDACGKQALPLTSLFASAGMPRRPDKALLTPPHLQRAPMADRPRRPAEHVTTTHTQGHKHHQPSIAPYFQRRPVWVC